MISWYLQNWFWFYFTFIAVAFIAIGILLIDGYVVEVIRARRERRQSVD